MRMTHGEYIQEHPLPFILKDKRGRVLSCWHAPTTGDWFQDSKLGDAYAFDYSKPCTATECTVYARRWLASSKRCSHQG